MKKMNGEERGAYIAGLVDGLAQARWLHDGKQGNGSKCIHDWYYLNTRGALLDIYAVFDKYPSYPPATIVAVLAEKRCPAT